MRTTRYILDTIYGVLYFPDFIWDILFIPEIQRLRELRLYNINSLYFTGGANINRYEHSLGTCYLAIQCIESNHKDLAAKDKKLIILAALLHDLYNGAFGHTVEYVEGFSPEQLFANVVMGAKHDSFNYRKAQFEPIYFGMFEEIANALLSKLKLTTQDIMKIGEYITGKGEFGKLISGTIDLDNIDNIYRMSWHMGISTDRQTPLRLARSLSCKHGQLHVKEEAIPLVQQWIHCREILYKFLLLNPDEFSAKFMLTEAIEQSIATGKKVYNWYDTDFQVLDKLSKSTSDVQEIVSRLMKGELYGCLGLYSTDNIDKKSALLSTDTKKRLEEDLNGLVKLEVSQKVSRFSAAMEKSIKGIVGISYDNKTKILKITHKMKKHVIDKLLGSSLKKLRLQVRDMIRELDRRKSTYGQFSNSISLGIHTITDINKVHRMVQFCVDGKHRHVSLGTSASRLYIGVFIRNKKFANFNFCVNRGKGFEGISNIKREVAKHIRSYLKDPEMQEILLYSESNYDKISTCQ